MTERTALLFGSYDVRLHPRVAVVRDGLRDRGWVVTQLNAPLGSSTADKVAAAGSVRGAAALVGRMALSWGRLAAGRRSAGRPDVVVVGYLGHLDVHLARILFPGVPIVLDHLVSLADTMRDRRLSGALALRLAEALDRWALHAADVVVVDTAAQADELPPAAHARTVVVPVGATDDWRRAARVPPSADPSHSSGVGGELRVVFFGLYTPLQGAPVVGEAIALLRDDPIRFTMVGNGQDRAATESAARGGRATWIDWVEPGDLPELVAAQDVCLGVFGSGPKTPRVVPTKVYQGLAAGCAVVTGDTPAARSVLDGDVALVPVDDPDALARELRELASDGAALERLRERAEVAADRFTPARAVGELDDLLTRDTRRAGLPPLTMNAWLRWDVIREVVGRSGAHDVVEVGPGEGAMACRLAIGRSYTGVESSERTRRTTDERLRQRCTPGHLVASFDNLAAGRRFDLLCAFEVLEHIEDDRGAVQQWAEHLRPGGTILLSVPAGPGRLDAADELAGHIRRYSASSLAEVLDGAGLVDIDVVHIGFPVGYGLEAVRNAVARRRLAADAPRSISVEERTEHSSSFLQPPTWAGTALRIASLPGRVLQRRVTSHGTGLVASARVPG